MNEWTPNYLAHHGIKGQRWGVRRFQNENGTLTPAGQKRYGEKVTMHNGKSGFFTGGAKYKTHSEYMTANKFAKGTYLQNKQRIKDQKKADLAKADTFGKKVGAHAKAFGKNLDNKNQYRYELDRNRHNAGKEEFKREIAVNAAKRGAKAAAVVGAGIVAGMLHANYMNNSSKRKAAGALTMAGMDNYYEYKVGKKQVAKYLGKAVAVGAIYGGLKAVNDNLSAEERMRDVNRMEKSAGIQNTRRKRAEADEERWKKGRV